MVQGKGREPISKVKFGKCARAASSKDISQKEKLRKKSYPHKSDFIIIVSSENAYASQSFDFGKDVLYGNLEMNPVS